MIHLRTAGSTVEWKNPRTEEWTPISSWSTPQAAEEVRKVYLQKKEWLGWTPTKLSKSNQRD